MGKSVTKCKACEKEVAITADVCPHCGQKNPGVTWKAYLLGFFVLTVVVLLLFKSCSSDEQDAETAAQEAAAEAAALEACKQDLKCWGKKYRSLAGAYCEEHVEKQAKFSHQWTDESFGEVKFPYSKWADQSAGHLRVMGDKIQFQNGFGAWTNMRYACDFDPATESVLSVTVEPGRF